MRYEYVILLHFLFSSRQTAFLFTYLFEIVFCLTTMFDKFILNALFWLAKTVPCQNFHPFFPNAPFLYHLKISENLKVNWEQMG